MDNEQWHRDQEIGEQAQRQHEKRKRDDAEALETAIEVASTVASECRCTSCLFLRAFGEARK